MPGRLGPPRGHRGGLRVGGAGWPGCSASKACQQNEKAQHTSVQCRRIARSLLTWKSAQPSSSQPIWSVAGQRVAVGPSPVRRGIPCLTEVGPRGVESQRRWRILSAPDLVSRVTDSSHIHGSEPTGQRTASCPRASTNQRLGTLGAGRVSRTRSASTTARWSQPSASRPRAVRGDGGGEAVLGGVVDDYPDPPDPAAGGLELGEVHLRVVPSSGAGGDR